MKQLTIFYQNVRGLKSKLPSLQIIAAEYCPSIICIVETHLSENDPDFAQWSEDVEGDQSLFQIEGYNVIRNDRNGSGGGCLIAYKKELRTLITELDADAEKHENLWITVGNDVAKIKLGVIYMPGENTRKKELQDAYKEIESELHNRKPNERLLIWGDFNAKLKIEEQTESPAGEAMSRFIMKNDLVVMNYSEKCVGKWTRVERNTRSVIDYVLTSNDCYVNHMMIDEEKDFSVYYHKKEQGETKKIYSDHNAILTNVKWGGVLELRNKDEKIRIMTKKGFDSYKQQFKRSQQCN